MKRVLLLFIATVLMAFSSVAPSYAQQYRTIESEMKVIHESLGVNFVYDSSMDLNVPYYGKPMVYIIKGNSKDKSEVLAECLKNLFAGTNIECEIMKKYVVLTQADKRKKPKDYTIFIEEQQDTLDVAIVTALVDPKRNSTQTGLKRIDAKTINSGFALFSTPDVIKTLQMLPGVSSGTELLSGFYVHGGDGSDNLFLLDGVPIYQSSHLLGLFSAFNSDVISNLDFYKSGFPARYGSKMSSVVDITTEDGDFKEYHGLFAVGLLDGRFQFEGPLKKDKTSFNFGLRRTWTETVTMPIFAYVNKENAPDKIFGRYAFTDLNAKITHKFSDRSVLVANFYTGRDLLRINDDQESRWAVGTPGYAYDKDIMNFKLSWGNTVGSINWNYDVTDKLSMSNKFYYSGSLSGFMYKEENYENYKEKNQTYDMMGLTYNSNVHTVGWRTDFFHSIGTKHKLRYGATAQLHLYRPNYTAEAEEEQKMPYNHYYAKLYADSLVYNTVEAAVYAEDEITVS